MKKTNENLMFYMSVICGSVFFCTLMFMAYGKLESQVFSSQSGSHKSIVLDPGHGGEDGGAVGNDGIMEKNINLEIAKKLRDILEASGYQVTMTRNEDTAIYDDSAGTLRQKKRSDLRNRLEMIKSASPENSIFVSIHQNKFPDSKYFGTQIFYSKNHPKSQQLADYIKQSVTGLIQPDNTREIKPADKNIYLLHNASIPAVVVECGFLSNSEESHKLSTKEYQEEMAFCIYCGITNYFTNV